MWIDIDIGIVILPIFSCLQMPVEGITARETQEIIVF